MSPPNPLTHDDLERLNQALQLVGYAQDWIRRLHACGADCAGHNDTAAYVQQRLEAFKREFFGAKQ